MRKTLLLPVCLVACVTPGAKQRTRIQFPETEIRAGPPAEIALSDLNDEELFLGGQAAYAAGEWANALLHFERLADIHLDSPHRVKALYNAGLAHAKLGQHGDALTRFSQIVEEYPRDPDALEARFRASEAIYFLGDYEAAIARLDEIAKESSVPLERRAEAETKRGICEFQSGKPNVAELSLKLALKHFRDAEAETALDDYYPSQAQFYLGEIYRSFMRAVRLDPTSMDEKKLGDELEYKAQHLLSAQGHYLRCIRLGHTDWATAAGFRIGELYEAFHDDMVQAPVPRDLDDEHIVAYLAELRRRVKVLIDKAIATYEQTLATAERVGAVHAYVQETRHHLERLKLLLQDQEGDAPAAGAVGPSAPATAASPDGT